MHRNPFWILFLCFIIIGILGYTLRTSYHLWQYIRLNKQTSTQEIQWAIDSLSDEEFAPFARYQFSVKGKNFQGQTLWNEIYLNPSTAHEAILRLSKKSPQFVWFDSSNPQISTLQKLFPLKESIYTTLLWILGFYFIGLGFYTKQRFPSFF